MGKNDNKNDNPNNPIPNAKQFTSDYQPSPKAKSRGWEKRRIKQEILDLMTELDIMSMSDFDKLRKDIEEHPENHTVREARLLRYMTREKFILDYLDRNLGKAPQDIDITTQGNKITSIEVKIIDSQDEIRNESNEDTSEDTPSREEV